MSGYRTILNLQNIDLGLLIFRIGIAALMLTHGFPKLLKFFGEEELSFADPIGLGEPITLTLAVFAEFFCSLFIIFGYLTRYAALAIITTMVVAVFIVHWEDPFSKMELPLLFMFGFILIAFTGPGKFSLDFYLKQKFK